MKKVSVKMVNSWFEKTSELVPYCSNIILKYFRWGVVC
jgi:hypothetical protein